MEPSQDLYEKYVILLLLTCEMPIRVRCPHEDGQRAACDLGIEADQDAPISCNFRHPGVYYRNPQFQLKTVWPDATSLHVRLAKLTYVQTVRYRFNEFSRFERRIQIWRRNGSDERIKFYFARRDPAIVVLRDANVRRTIAVLFVPYELVSVFSDLEFVARSDAFVLACL